ncbi:MAG: Asp-tRNA(Asn)/Glu-tRNA(Gln) amidotransferase subunit GatC [Cyclobacteriaceae bacterium]|nr:Asp-tRNA(Asn)/Glu-tRNA(Gln) amidotransferase subunit GatC [Cyclobacteriaceae bacterium]
MKINRETLQKLAHLARIEIDPSEEKGLIKDMEQIISWVEKLDELDTGQVKPITNMSFEVNAMREDTAQNTLTRTEALKNAPDRSGDFFKVPKVLD